MKRKFVIWIIFILCLVACSNLDETRTYTVSSNLTLTPSLIQSVTQTKLINTPSSPSVTEVFLPTTTPTLAPISANLASGNYLMCYKLGEDGSSKHGYLEVIDVAGDQTKRVSPLDPLVDWDAGTYTTDGKYYVYRSQNKNIFIVNLIDWSQNPVPDIGICNYSGIGYLNKDGNQLLFQCGEDIKLKVINVRDGTLAGVIPDPDQRDLMLLQGRWSPDGKWIAYIGTENKRDYNVGPYIASVDCLQNTEACQKKVMNIGICIGGCTYWWTSDNFLAVDYTNDYPNQIGFFDPQTGTLVRNEDLGGVDNLADYSWSPDGRYLVIENTRENGARVVKEITSGEVLFDLDDVGCDLFLGWLSIP